MNFDTLNNNPELEQMIGKIMNMKMMLQEILQEKVNEVITS